jgi:uncharacterized protein YecE (DUF72 family)
MARSEKFIGTAGWGISARHREFFPPSGSGLERYAARLNAAEINSSFYRPHRRATYEKWAASVPETFRFSVKMPKAITHERRLVDCKETLGEFLGQAEGLGRKLGVLLVQLPPSLRFDASSAGGFLRLLRGRTAAGIALEPRHASWLAAEPEALLRELRIARIAADPDRPSGAASPGGWAGLSYFRLHGSPRTYYSDYPPKALAAIAERLEERAAGGSETWCIFDNTAEGHALSNALAVLAMASP